MKKFEISCNLSFDGMEVRPGSSGSPGERRRTANNFSRVVWLWFPSGVPGPAEDDGVRESGSGGRGSRRRRHGQHQPTGSQERWERLVGAGRVIQETGFFIVLSVPPPPLR